MEKNEAAHQGGLTLDEFGDLTYFNLIGMAHAQNMLRKPGEEKTRDNRTILEKRIAAIPRAHALLKSINVDGSKEGIYAAKHRNEERADECIEQAKADWKELLELPLPPNQHHQFVQDAGQELIEMMVVVYLTPALYGDFEAARSAFTRIPMPEDPDLRIPYTAWLAGMTDAITELGKLANDILLQQNLTIREQEEVMRRMLIIGKTMHNFLEQFENEPPAVTNDTHRRGQGFKDKLRRVWIYLSERLQPLVLELRRQRELHEAMTRATQQIVRMP